MTEAEQRLRHRQATPQVPASGRRRNANLNLIPLFDIPDRNVASRPLPANGDEPTEYFAKLFGSA